jgi:hypothetical protein
MITRDKKECTGMPCSSWMSWYAKMFAKNPHNMRSRYIVGREPVQILKSAGSRWDRDHIYIRVCTVHV